MEKDNKMKNRSSSQKSGRGNDTTVPGPLKKGKGSARPKIAEIREIEDESRVLFQITVVCSQEICELQDVTVNQVVEFIHAKVDRTKPAGLNG